MTAAPAEKKMELQLPRAKNWTANWAHKKRKNSKKKSSKKYLNLVLNTTART